MLSLSAALLDCASEALSTSSDKLIRVESLLGQDPAEFVAKLDPNKAYRFGLTGRSKKIALGRSKGVSSDAAQLTKWRNEPTSKRINSPIVLIGDASGREEAGLRKTPIIVDEVMVLRRWRQLLNAKLGAYATKKPCGFALALLEMAIAGLIDVEELSQFITSNFSDEKEATEKPQANLWRLGLIPDARAMDSNTPGPRLSINYKTVEFLREPPDSARDELQHQRITNKAEVGDATAIALSEFRETQDERHLRPIQLDDVLNVLSKSKKEDEDTESASRPKEIDIYDALDSESFGPEVLIRLDEKLTLKGEHDEVSIHEALSPQQDISLEFVREQERAFIAPDSTEQVLFTLRSAGATLDAAGKVYDKEFKTLAKIADQLLNLKEFSEAAEELLATRQQALFLCQWPSDLLTTLILKSEYRNSARLYLEAWTRLAELLVENPHPQAQELANSFRQLDADWEISDSNSVEAVELWPIHPFVLRPLVDLSDYAVNHVGEVDLGTKLSWASERLVPAYPALWQDENALIQSEAGNTPRYQRRADASLPHLASGGGLTSLLAAYLGVYPHGKKHISVLLIDPPAGRGVTKALEGITAGKTGVDVISVYILNTRREQVSLPELKFRVDHLGLTNDVQKFAEKTPLRFNICIHFMSPQAEHLGTHIGQQQPSRGLHNVITVSANPKRLGSEISFVPLVSVQPRDSNSVVRLFMQIARGHTLTDKWYEMAPVLDERRERVLIALGAICDWVVLATAAPMGLVPPRRFAGGALSYLGRETTGQYALYVYSSDLFPVRKRIQQRLLQAPIVPDVVGIERQIQAHADATPNGVLRCGMAGTALIGEVGLIVAARFAESLFDPEDYFICTLSVDALEWTRHWLGNRRCDLIAVGVAKRPEIGIKVRLVAVESKARSGSDEIAVSPKEPAFEEAIAQITLTLEALNAVVRLGEDDLLLADLKQSAFVEHLVSEVLAKITPIKAEEAWKREIFKLLSALSRRELMDTEVELTAVVVVTQPDATVPLRSTEMSIATDDGVQFTTRLIRCGIPELRRLFGPSGGSVSLGAMTQEVEPLSQKVEKSSYDEKLEEPESAHLSNVSKFDLGLSLHENVSAEVRQSVKSIAVDPETLDLSRRLEAACRLRNFKIENIDPGTIVHGPTLTNMPVVLEPGESIRPIEAALPDLARELGVRSVAVENDPRPYHVRFLLPRLNRIFPTLPPTSVQVFDPSRNQYFGLLLGQTVDGLDHRSWLSEWPHLLVAGTTGSGKTTLLKSIVSQLGQLPHNLIKVVVIDGKGEFDYVGILRREYYENRYPDVLLGSEHVTEVLRWVVTEEIPSRRESLRRFLTDNPEVSRQPREAFVQLSADRGGFPISPLVIVIDEFAELMLAAGAAAKEFEELVQRAVQTGRSCLVHLILATQRPDANVIKGAIKANLPSRIALALPSHHDSMTILNSPGAEELLGSGDMFFYSSSGLRLRLQGYRL